MRRPKLNSSTGEPSVPVGACSASVSAKSKNVDAATTSRGFLWPLVIAPDQNFWTVQIALSTFLTAQTINLPQLFIAATIAILPLVVMFVFLQRWIVEGVERSGISE